MKKTCKILAFLMAVLLLVPCFGSAESEYPSYLNLDGYRPIVKEGEKVTIRAMVVRDNVPMSVDINDTWFARFIEEELNIDLDIEEVKSDSLSTRRNLMFASGDIPDVMFNVVSDGADLVTYGISEGLLLPLNQYVSETLTPALYAVLNNPENADAVAAYTLPDGNMYNLPSIKGMKQYALLVEPYATNFGGASYRMYLNSKWMEAVGVEKLPQTLDEFVDLLYAFKELDPAQFGLEEIIPLGAVSNMDRVYLLNAFGYNELDWKGVDPAIDMESRTVTIPCSDEKFGEYLKLLHQLYEDGILSEDYITMDDTEMRALAAEGNFGALSDWAEFLSRPNDWMDFVAAMPLTSQYNTVPFSPATAGYENGNASLSAATEYPELIMRLIDYLYTPEGTMYSMYGPKEGSPDTLGIVDGFHLDEKNNPAYAEVENGTFESEYYYLVNRITMYQQGPRDQSTLQADMRGLDSYITTNDWYDMNVHFGVTGFIAAAKYFTSPLPTAYLDSDTQARVAELKASISNYVEKETAKFIVGQRSLDELDNYYAELKDLGIDEYKQIYVDYYADYMAKRSFPTRASEPILLSDIYAYGALYDDYAAGNIKLEDLVEKAKAE